MVISKVLFRERRFENYLGAVSAHMYDTVFVRITLKYIADSLTWDIVKDMQYLASFSKCMGPSVQLDSLTVSNSSSNV